MRRIGAVAVGVVVLLGGGGCGDDGDSLEDRRREVALERAGEARDAGWDEAAAVLADGEVTDAEYDRTITGYVECLEANGVTVERTEPDVGNPNITNVIHGPGTTEEVIEECQIPISGVEELRQLDPAPMAPELRDAMAECMAREGVPLEDDDDDLGDMARRSPGRRGADVVNLCLGETVFRIYPDLERVTSGPPWLL